MNSTHKGLPPFHQPSSQLFGRKQSWIRSSSTRPQLVRLLVAICALTAVTWWWRSGSGSYPAYPRTTGSSRQVLLRVGSLSNEGAGSAPQHFKTSILLAELLDRQLVLNEFNSEHNYSLSNIFNAPAASHQDLKFTFPICEVTLQGKAFWDRLRAACADASSRRALQAELRREYAHCGTIIHKVDSEEIVEDMNACVHSWFRNELREPICADKWAKGARADEPPTGPVKVGVHFRWGDTAAEEKDLRKWAFKYRGILVEEINAAMDVLARCDIPMDVTVYSQGLPRDINAQFPFKHTVVDSGHDLQDMCRLGQSEVILAGASGYSLMAWQLGRNRLSLIPKRGMYKYDNTKSKEFTAVSLDGLDESVCKHLARPAGWPR